MPTPLRAMRADITTLAVDAIVKAASWSLRAVIFGGFSAADLHMYERLLGTPP